MRILSGRERGGKASLQVTVVKDVLVSQISKRHFCSGASQGLLPSWITCFDLPTAGAALPPAPPPHAGPFTESSQRHPSLRFPTRKSFLVTDWSSTPSCVSASLSNASQSCPVQLPASLPPGGKKELARSG